MKYDILKGYTIIDGFGFTSVTFPKNVHDAIIVKCDGVSECLTPSYDVPCHGITEYIEYINANKIEKAQIFIDDLSFILKCPSLKYIYICPSYAAPPSFDYSPIYELPTVKSFACQTVYGDRNCYETTIDYSKINGLVDLGINYTKGSLNFNKVSSLKSLQISNYVGKSKDLTDVFSSRELDTLRMISCGTKSLNGIETSYSMQCLYLHNLRSLQDINALESVKDTLKALCIDCCGKIADFSVLKKLENVELLRLLGSNTLPNLDFLKHMKKLKTFVFDMNIDDGDLSSCLNLSYVYCGKNRKHYNYKDCDLPKGTFERGNDGIDQWRRIE